MTWQVSPEEWLLDFTAIPRGRSRAGESLDVIDDRLRAMLAPAVSQAGIIIPTITASRASRPAAVPVPSASSTKADSGPRPEAPSLQPPAEPEAAKPGLSVELHPVGAPAPIPPPPASAAMVIPTLTRPGMPVDDDIAALERLTPIGGTELGIPHDDADDLMSAVASSAMLGMPSTPVVAAPPVEEAKPASAPPEEHDEIEDEALEMQEVVEPAAAKPVEKPAPPPRPAPAPAPPPPTPPAAAPAPPPRPPVPPPTAAAGPPRPPPAPEKAAAVPPPRPAPDKAPPRPAAPAVPVATPRADSGPKKRGWHDDVFGDYYGAIAPIDTDTSADLDAAFVQKCLDLTSGMTLLDVGCGDGRHALAFARMGLDVTGLDNSMPQLLRAARRNEASSRFSFDILHGDMRQLPRDRAYDVVSCLGTTFGYFETDDQNRQCLQDMVEVLKPGGKLVLHVFNRDYLMGVLPCRSWWQGRGCLVLDVADMNFFHGRVRIHRTVVFEDGRQYEHHISIRAYAVNDLGRMLTQAGARVVEVSGSRDTRGRFYGAASPDIWIFAQRRDDG